MPSRFSRTNRFLYALFTSGYAESIDNKLRGKIILFNTVVLVGVAMLTPFGIARLIQGSTLLGCVDLSSALVLAALSIYHWTIKTIVVPRIVTITIVGSIFGYLAISTGYHDTGLLWSYCLPAVTIFILDRNRGSLILLLYMALLVTCFSVPAFPCYGNYDLDLKLSFLSSFAAVWMIAYYFEHLLSSLYKEANENNSQLRKSISELNDTRDQLFHAQKLEAIGRLAGGIAHDYNNILAGIGGYADLIKHKSAADPVINGYAAAIVGATKRAADLTAKLLAYARKGKIEMVAFDLHQVIGDVIEISRHTMDKRIIIRQALAAAQSTVMGDRGQFQNAIVNLAINANDAMPGGGELVFATENAFLAEGSAGYPDYMAKPGHYLKFSLSDTGNGMDAATLAKAFEPFFTTKEKGKGTGLGLSSVYGTVKSHNGYIGLKSDEGKGTVVEIFLPLAQNVEVKPIETPMMIPKGHGAVLFVDDEDVIRTMACEMSRVLGYSLISSKDGREALDYYRHHFSDIDLVVLDIIMPRMGGYDCFKAMKAINPQIKVLACSGYVRNQEVEKMLAQGALGFIQKPFSLEGFSKAVESALAGKPLN